MSNRSSRLSLSNQPSASQSNATLNTQCGDETVIEMDFLALNASGAERNRNLMKRRSLLRQRLEKEHRKLFWERVGFVCGALVFASICITWFSLDTDDFSKLNDKTDIELNDDDLGEEVVLNSCGYIHRHFDCPLYNRMEGTSLDCSLKATNRTAYKSSLSKVKVKLLTKYATPPKKNTVRCSSRHVSNRTAGLETDHGAACHSRAFNIAVRKRVKGAHICYVYKFPESKGNLSYSEVSADQKNPFVVRSLTLKTSGEEEIIRPFYSLRGVDPHDEWDRSVEFQVGLGSTLGYSFNDFVMSYRKITVIASTMWPFKTCSPIPKRVLVVKCVEERTEKELDRASPLSFYDESYTKDFAMLSEEDLNNEKTDQLWNEILNSCEAEYKDHVQCKTERIETRIEERKTGKPNETTYLERIPPSPSVKYTKSPAYSLKNYILTIVTIVTLLTGICLLTLIPFKWNRYEKDGPLCLCCCRSKRKDPETIWKEKATQRLEDLNKKCDELISRLDKSLTRSNPYIVNLHSCVYQTGKTVARLVDAVEKVTRTRIPFEVSLHLEDSSSDGSIVGGGTTSGVEGGSEGSI